MRFSVEAWAPGYGSPIEWEDPDDRPVQVDVSVETAAQRWAPRAPEGTPGGATLLFVDGVQRIDARVWIEGQDGRAQLGICATYGAGIARCDGRAEIVAAEIERGLFSAAGDVDAIATNHGRFAPRAAAGDSVEQLRRSVQQRMGALEHTLADRAGNADLVVVDGPLRAPRAVPNAIGYVKTHHVGYLPPIAEEVVAALAPGERTPLFLMTTSWSLYSWYVRLPGAGGHPWAGIVRCEADANLTPSEAVVLADRATVHLPRFASAPHKDPRAPQNLYPIAGLERELRRRSGDVALIYRALRVAAAA